MFCLIMENTVTKSITKIKFGERADPFDIVVEITRFMGRKTFAISLIMSTVSIKRLKLLVTLISCMYSGLQYSCLRVTGYQEMITVD